MSADQEKDELTGFSSLAIHSGYSPSDSTYSDIVQPISLSTVFEKVDPTSADSYCYSRFGNPNRTALETSLASLEDAKYAVTFSSGLAAIHAVFHALLAAGDHVVLGLNCYGETSAMIRSFAKFGISCSFIETRSTSDWTDAITCSTRLVWIESPTNPTMSIIDLEQVSAAVKQVDARIMLVADNTIMTSFLQLPLKLGIDAVVHSLTKYNNGHNDATMGAVVTNRRDIFEAVRGVQCGLGSVPSPLDCFLVSRGMKTMALRMRVHCDNAMAIATFLQSHPKVSGVMYPGLDEHPGREIAIKQSIGSSGLLSFYIKSRDEGAAVTFLTSLKVFKSAGTIGGVDSVTDLPKFSSSRQHTADTLARLGINQRLVRLSVGIESVSDLIADLEQAFDCVHD